MTKAQLITYIQQNVTTNANRENTGQRVRETLIEMVNGLGAGLEDTLSIDNQTGTYSIILTDGVSISGGDDPVTAPSINILNLGATGGANWMIGDRDQNVGFLKYNSLGLLQLYNGNGEVQVDATTSIEMNAQQAIGLTAENAINLSDTTGNYQASVDAFNGQTMMKASELSGQAKITLDPSPKCEIEVTDNGSNEISLILDPNNYNALQSSGSSIFINNDNSSFTNSNLFIQNNNAALRCYSADAVVEVTTGSNNQGLFLNRPNGTVDLINNEFSTLKIQSAVGDIQVNSATNLTLGSTLQVILDATTGVVITSSIQTFADNAAAITGGLGVGTLYVTPTGQLMRRY